MYHRRQFLRKVATTGASVGIMNVGLPDDAKAQMGGATMYEASPNTTCQVHSHWLRLSDGRRLSYAIFGPRDGFPIVLAHGIPLSRLEGLYWEQAAIDEGCLILAVDRPGIGFSSRAPGRTIAGWAADILQLVDFPRLPHGLQLNRFGLLGFSSGAAYTIACAHRLPPERVLSVGIVSGVAPLELLKKDGGLAATIFRLVQRRPRIAKIVFDTMTESAARDPDKRVDRLSVHLKLPDRVMLSQPWNRRVFTANFFQTVQCGTAGTIQDMSLLACPWGIPFEDIQHKIHLWHGGQDVVTPADSMLECLVHILPNVQVTMLPNHGHISPLGSPFRTSVLQQLKSDAGWS